MQPTQQGAGANAECRVEIGRDDRVLVLAPHPDDESVATGGLLSIARRSGAAVKVVLLTDGDNNPWAQRGFERRLWIGARDRARFAARRREETLAALAALGLAANDVSFLALPDQGLTGLLLRSNTGVVAAVTAELASFRPTVVALPSSFDLHPDHSATAVFFSLAVGASQGRAGLPRLLRYVVHNPALRQVASTSMLVLDADALAAKHAAIDCHRTQLVWRHGFLHSFVTATEHYFDAEPPAPHPLSVVGAGDGTVLGIGSRDLFRAFGRRTLCLVGVRTHGEDVAAVVPLPRLPGRANVHDPRDLATLGTATLAGRSRRGLLRLPPALGGPWRCLFGKVEHSFGFFDEAGWRRLA